jgi:hypothetical protein
MNRQTAVIPTDTWHSECPSLKRYQLAGDGLMEIGGAMLSADWLHGGHRKTGSHSKSVFLEGSHMLINLKQKNVSYLFTLYEVFMSCK